MPLQSHYWDHSSNSYVQRDTHPRYGGTGGTGVTDHAIRRFRKRIKRLPRQTTIRLLQGFLQEANVAEGEVIVTWCGEQISLIVRGSAIVTVTPVREY
jgi:hypothetical protein